MDYKNIFTKYFSRPAEIEIEFSALPNMDRKIDALEKIGVKIEEGKKYAVAVTIKRGDDESRIHFAARVENLVNPAAGEKVLEQNLKTYKAEIKKYGRDLGKAEKLDVLTREAGEKINGEKIKVENFGGSNFVSFCDWVRGLSAEDFERLTKSE